MTLCIPRAAPKVCTTSQIMSAGVFYAAKTLGSSTRLDLAPGALVDVQLGLAPPVPRVRAP